MNDPCVSLRAVVSLGVEFFVLALLSYIFIL